jgi:hypothetical protein
VDNGSTMQVRLVVLVPLLVAATAHAQAPGAYYDDLSPPGMAPAGDCACDVVAAAPMRPRRWSVGLNVGFVELAPHHARHDTTEYSLAQLAVRFRATRHLELELALGGGREQLAGGYDGDREVHSAVLAVRYRFRPEARWNWWLMAGLGTLSVTPFWASDAEREAAQQSTLQYGVGVERRFRRFAIQAELRAVGVAPSDDRQDYPVVTEPYPDGSRMEPWPPGIAPAAPGYGMAGGQFTIGGSFYF